MNLSDLVKLKNKLETLDFHRVVNSLQNLDEQLTLISNLTMENNTKEYVSSTIRIIDRAETDIDNKVTGKDALLATLQAEIDQQTSHMMTLGYKVNGYAGSDLTVPEVERTSRKLILSDDERGEIQTIAKSYTAWEYPCLEVGPGDGEWTPHLIAAQPLYLVDRHREYINNTLSQFNELFQRRVMTYITGVEDNRPEFDFSMLPKEQFGFIFAWNVLNFWPYNETEHSLKQFFDLLLPGGVMMFSYNNCDVPECADAAESGFKSFLTTRWLQVAFEKIGFEVIHFRSTSTHVHWVEIKKPGTLLTFKRHPTMGEIKRVID